ncbi:MAG: PLDc N-terminal domain-containing protein [Cellulomonadaceae bacterium]
MAHTSWKELSGKRKVFVTLLTSAQLALTVAAYKDLVGRPGKEIEGSKLAWGIALLVNWIGPLAYFAKGRRP